MTPDIIDLHGSNQVSGRNRVLSKHIVQTVLDADGGALKDDATAMCLDWLGSPTSPDAEEAAGLVR
jgi:hypothetical protein